MTRDPHSYQLGCDIINLDVVRTSETILGGREDGDRVSHEGSGQGLRGPDHHHQHHNSTARLVDRKLF